MNKSTICKGRVYLGKVNRNASSKPGHGPRNCAAYITFELRQTEHGPEFSAQAEAWNNRRTDIFIGRQCVDTLAEEFPGHKTAQRLLAIWKKWHLNGMKAGTPAQMAEIERRTKLARDQFPSAIYSDGSINWYKLAEFHGLNSGASHYDLACLWLREAGLYETPIPDVDWARWGKPAMTKRADGVLVYTYGHAWLYEPMPSEVADEIKFLASTYPST